VSIQLSARRPAWIRITADGRVTAERIFKPGETQVVRATREVNVRAGDAGAVTVSVAGRPPVALGREGEVVTRRFAADAPRAPQPRSDTAAVAPPAARTPAPPAQAALQQPAPDNGTRPTATAGLTPASRPAIDPPVSSSPAVTPTAPPAAAVNAPARPPAALAERPAATTVAPTTQKSLEALLTNETRRWLDAYYRQDRATMAAISAKVSVDDDREDKERLPKGLSGVQRSLDDVKFQTFGQQAMLTAKMTERMDDAAAGQMAEAVSFVSQIWLQRNGTWQLETVRIVSAAGLARALR
jgi:hypothetical protein